MDTAEHNYKMKTIFDLLTENGLSWNIYYGDIPQSLMLQHHWHSLSHFKRFEQFHADLEKGELASYTFIEPRFFSFHEWKANDQHPPHDVRMGEYLIAEVYDTIRSSPFWEKSLLVVLYDEHGGFFDRVSPPSPVPNPDGKNAKHPPFDYTRLGVRVPIILVSPFVEKGQADSTVYDQPSIPATVKSLFGLPEGLTARDKAANTFEKNLSRSSPRADARLALPVPGEPEEAGRHRELIRTNALEQWARGEVDQGEMSHEPLSLFQTALMGMAHRLNEERPGGPVSSLRRTVVGLAHRLRAMLGKTRTQADQIRTEHEAAVHIHKDLDRFLNR